MQSLEMKKPVLLLESPDRPNIAYAVKVVAPSPSIIFQKMVQDIKEHKKQYGVLLYCSLMMKCCHEDIKMYAKYESECCRKTLLANFDAEVSSSREYEHLHQCCDICQANCKCLGSSCHLVDMPSQVNEQQGPSVSQF